MKRSFCTFQSTVFSAIALLGSAAVSANARAAESMPAVPGVVVTVSQVNPAGVLKPLGTVTVTETRYGLVFTPDLQGLPPGVHGFHVHENGSPAAISRRSR